MKTSKTKSRRPSLVWSLAGAGAGALSAYIFLVRPWHLRWGATDEEAGRELPGDELVPEPRLNATHAITIHALVGDVWPWLAQLGQGRGGFYSYEWVENLMGADIQNTNRILPEYQNPQVGDKLPLAQGGFGIPIAILEPGRHMVLHGDTREAGPGEPQIVKPGDYLNLLWGFYLEPTGEGETRLVERFRADWNPSFSNAFYMHAFMEPGAFIMERGMLLGIKRRAEGMKKTS